MAQKRAYVGAVISAVGASEFYTQDVEDLPKGVIRDTSPVEEFQTNSVGPGANSLPSQDTGSYVIRVGKKYAGKKLSEVPRDQLLNYANWLGKQENLNEAAEEFIERVSEYADYNV
jgi:hypothetical protein